jgi:CheY-like chemotaxis protein
MTGTLSILIVEDREDVAQSTAELLHLCGHAVRVSIDGADALRGAAAEPADVMLVDIRLPGMGGWELTRHLRALIRGKQSFVVAVTGCGTERDQWYSAEAGMDAHLVKPVDPVRLIELLDRIRRSLL